jgi:hypothetical protein
MLAFGTDWRQSHATICCEGAPLQVHDRVPKLLQHRIAAGVLLAVCCCAAPVGAQRTIVIGFVGGRVHANNDVHLEVRMAEKLQRLHPVDAVVKVYANHQGDDAFNEVMRQIDTDHDGKISPAERSAARVVIYGHSWGGSQTVTLAQQLNREKIPVLLTVQVDSIAKSNQVDDGEIPGNVEQAINFYQDKGMLHGRSVIRATEPGKTKNLGNIRSDYSVNKIDCHEFPWFARTFMLPHIEIENDARVWDRIEAMIEEKIAESPVAVNALAVSHTPASNPAQ